MEPSFCVALFLVAHMELKVQKGESLQALL
jgi:hypothetical protein